ncbi:MAG TPA: metallophosphoesterase [Myxococcota bacterium]|nr:metallophosphoesterase [Myxococcota bacterium]
MRRPTSSFDARRFLLCVVLAAAVLACHRGEGPPPPPLPGPARFSFLAVGDTGIPPQFASSLLSTQIAVARGMEAEDRRAPVGAFVLLGDNFYYKGLEESELVLRVRENVVRPYCRFLALTAPRSNEVASACGTPPQERRAIPFYVVLGNHDYEYADSPALQAEAVPRFVANWKLAVRPVEVIGLAPGVDLVLFDSESLVEGADPLPLRTALAATRGPWRILAAHHPIARGDGDEEAPTSQEKGYRDELEKLLADAGIPVQLFLSGHVHNLQVLEEAPPAPALNVIAGAGSRPRPVRGESPHRLFALAEPGFARVDLVTVGGEERLVASLYVTRSLPLFARREPTLVARYSVDLAGRVRDELAAR